MQQNILEKHPSSKVEIYTIWFSIYFRDDWETWQSGTMPDPRVTHLWDESSAVSEWFTTNVFGQSGRMYDVYVLYGPDSTWESTSRPPNGLISSGGTVLGKRDELEAGLLPLLK